MKISFNTIPGNLNLSVGYGYAGFNMIRSLQQLGHEVPFQDPGAPVEIAFSQPQHWRWSNKRAYHIGYVPWESTGLRPGWVEAMNNRCDEIWTPSPLIAQWFRDAGVKKPVKVYEHGVDHQTWTPKRRRSSDKLRFLHVGEPAPRKGGQLALDAFRAAFGDSEKVSLTIKAHGYNTALADNNVHPDNVYNNVKVRKSELDLVNLVRLFQFHDVLVYPSFGEGFGLIPLQALATGMPVICTESWAPYSRFILPELRLRSTLGRSPFPTIHPGKMFHPDYTHLVETYQTAATKFDHLSALAYANSRKVAQEYDWVKVTEDAFAHIVEKFSN